MSLPGYVAVHKPENVLVHRLQILHHAAQLRVQVTVVDGSVVAVTEALVVDRKDHLRARSG